MDNRKQIFLQLIFIVFTIKLFHKISLLVILPSFNPNPGYIPGGPLEKVRSIRGEETFGKGMVLLFSFSKIIYVDLSQNEVGYLKVMKGLGDNDYIYKGW